VNQLSVTQLEELITMVAMRVQVEEDFTRSRLIRNERNQRTDGVSLSRAISPRKRDSTSMASEYLVLTDIASNLSTYVQNRSSSNPSHQSPPFADKHAFPNHAHVEVSIDSQGNGGSNNINEDAKLLLNLKEVVPQADDVLNEMHDVRKESVFPTTISPSLSFEARRYFEEQSRRSQYGSTKYSRRVSFLDHCTNNKNDDARTFSFTTPSLSLHNITREGTRLTTTTPAQLLSRPLAQRSTLDVSEIAETVASNVMQSFTSALEWRSKVWIMQLSRMLSLKFKQEAAKLDKPNHSKSSSKKQNKQQKKNNQGGKSGLDALKEKFKKSQEARVINALSQTRSSIIVHDVRTTFFVLEEQHVNATLDEEEKKEDFDSFDSLKSSQVFRPRKARRTVTNELSTLVANKVGPTKYTLSHALNLDSRCSVSISSEKKIAVSLQTPGTIHGTFVRNEDGDVVLVEMSIDLDTQNLAYSIEQKSRVVVRSAAEECIVSPIPTYATPLPVQQVELGVISDDSSYDVSTASNDEEIHKDNGSQATKDFDPSITPKATTDACAYEYNYGMNALITPNEREYNSSDSEDMPPPPPRLPMEAHSKAYENRSSFLNPRRVSPPNADDLSPTPVNESCYVTSVKGSPPPLVSPTFTTRSVGQSIKTLEQGVLHGKGPILPALVEAACAVHNKSN
jgi:hypothetical protein